MRQDKATIRLIPSKPAAIALLTLDSLLLLGWALCSRHNSWFAIIYIPLLATAALGILMSGYGKLVVAINVVVVGTLSLTMGVLFGLQLVPFEKVSVVLGFGWVILASLGLVLAVATCAGWVRYFAGRPAAA